MYKLKKKIKSYKYYFFPREIRMNTSDHDVVMSEAVVVNNSHRLCRLS